MNTLVLTTALADELLQAAQRDVEVAGVLLVRILDTAGGDRRLLGRAVRWVPEYEYIQQTPIGLQIPSTGYVPSLSEAEKNGEVAIWFHTHPGRDAIPQPSSHDQKVDQQISELFRIRSGSPYYGTLILSPRRENCAFTGTIHHEDRTVETIDQLWIVGERWRLLSSFNSETAEVPIIFDRNVRAFGPAMQQALSALRIRPFWLDSAQLMSSM
jgi:proteasome lid subunit RPN8/RPN11